MQDRVFLDSNILLYCYSNTELDKQKVARDIFEKYDNPHISKQVVNEVSKYII